ncbi:hypothetical protein TRFO_20721 [Tritrichomonas foetus]|uniref:Uncharacterized protein n=1 Tax=Tritrichomonas foetus TaxID=1144522 RepID=A0A1J4KF72_9EUKA|nr:hypothetical protein TRFO_20721 [Tritrichomonas foetus]|eukprot:OHT10095.1 hypothetical protein TRFO_20721 [Tritrichomonas foetus]
MKYFKFLKRFYPLYVNILYKCPNSWVFQAFSAFFSYFHFLFLCIDLHVPSGLMNVTLSSPVVYHFQCIFYFLPWIFGTTTYLFDGIIYLCLNIVSFILLFHAQKKTLQREHLPHWELYFIHFYQSTFAHTICYPMFFRICLLVEHLGSYNDGMTWTSFAICCINLLMISVHIYFSSVFLSSIVFVSKSIFDTYDGKSNMLLFLFRFIFTGVSHLITMTDDLILVSLIAILLFVLAMFLFYYRIVLTIHVSFFTQYLEIAPLFVVPFIIFIHLFTKKTIFAFLVILVVHILIIISIYLCNHLILKESLRLFSALLKENDIHEGGSGIPHLVPGNIVSVLRLIAVNSGDPIIFDRVLILQHRFGVKASPMIEIVRFLGIFPSRRKAMIKELSKLRSASNYNRFTIYLFMKFLRSLEISSDERHTQSLDILQRAFLVHNHLYWQARANNHRFEAFKESCATSYYFIELRQELMNLIQRYPFDSYLYLRYSDFSLIGCGDFTRYKKSAQIAADLEKNRNFITDPLLHRMVKINARVLQFCSDDEILASMPTHSSPTASSLNEVPLASFLSISRRMIPFLPILHLLMVSVCFIVYFACSIPFETYTRNQYDKIYAIAPDLERLFDATTGSVFFPFALEYSTDGNFSTITDPQQCLLTFNELFYTIIDFFSLIPQVNYLATNIFLFAQNYSLFMMKNDFEICQGLSKIPETFEIITRQYLRNLTTVIQGTISQISNLYIDVSKEYNSKPFYLYNLGVAIIIIVLYFILFLFQVNGVFKKKQEAINFLSSKERITSLLLERSIESWEQLRHYLPHQIEIQNTYVPHINSILNNLSVSSSIFNSMSLKTVSDDSSTTAGLKNMKLDPTRVSVSFTGVATQLFASKSSMLKDYGIENIKISRSAPQSDDEQEMPEKEVSDLDDSPIELTISTTKKETAHTWIFVPLNIYLPWFILVLSCLLLLIPMSFRLSNEKELTSAIIYSGIQLNASVFLIEETLKLLKGLPYNPSVFLQIHEIILNKTTNVTELFTREQCFQLNSITCTSISTLVYRLAFNRPSDNDLLLLHLPAFIYFGNTVLNDIFFGDSDPYLEMPTSSVIAFFVDFFILLFFALMFSIVNSSALMNSFNSLYHFPSLFLENNSKKKSKVKKEKFPSSVITIASVVESDEIYSISENAATILNRPAPSFIGEKFSEVFPIVPADVELREHVMPDRIKKKLFRSRTVKRGELLITQMIEDFMQGIIKPAYLQESMAEKLMNYIPTFYAKSYCDNNHSAFDYESPILMILRYDSSKPQNELERFYTTVNACIMNYSSFKIIRADGSLFSFCSTKKVHPLVAFLFARDIISEGISVARAKPTQAPLALYMEPLESLKVSINSDSEPFLETDIKDYPMYEKLVYNLGNQQIAFNDDYVNFNASSEDSTEIETIEYPGFTRRIRKLSFTLYSELLKKYM